MSHLLRSHAPISDKGWKLIDEEAIDRLTAGLGARRIVDFEGPFGFEYSSTNLGRAEPIANDGLAGITAKRRVVLPVVELRADFELSRQELLNADRGDIAIDTDPVALAALQMVEAENRTVFHGSAALGITGITEASPHPAIPAGSTLDAYPAAIANAVETLLRIGVAGPYALALGRDDYTAVVEGSEHGGYPVASELRKILGGPIVWAPGIDGGIVVSQRGGDFVFESGQDLSVGYWSADADHVRLYLEETFTFRVVSPEAAVAVGPVTA
ncbi:MAG: family 1 encapsulin nanocompartment shell protein [Solirubrobacteraceae bacterium]|nr:family 1 encapsulin nanocompartment shell protein [Solirubrobacteraceae bacterium]